MQETIKTIDNLQLCNEERNIEEDVIIQGQVTLKNAKLRVRGLLWITKGSCADTTMSMENSTIIADKVLIDPLIAKYENSRIIGREFHSFSY